MTTPITATQALEWAKEDIEARPVSGAREEDLAILDRWIKRVQDSKPTSPHALPLRTREYARQVVGDD